MTALPVKPGAPLSLTTAGDVETLVRAHGTRYVVTNRMGDIAPAGARELGFYADDMRHLSHYELALQGLSLVFLSADETDAAFNRIDLMVSGIGNQEFLDDPQHFLHIYRRQLVGEGFCETVGMVNYLPRAVELEVVLSFGVDFADVFEVRGARRARRGEVFDPVLGESAIEWRYTGLDGGSYMTRLELAPAPSSLRAGQAVFRVSLEAGETKHLSVAVEPRSPRRRKSEAVSAFDATARAQRASAERSLAESTHIGCDHLVLQQFLTQSALDLHALAIDFEGERVLAAGVPWFSCPFGRDTLIAAYEALVFDPQLAASSLRALAARQGRKYDDFTEEEPGKIFHELRSGEMVASGELPHAPYFGSVDATPLFVVVAHAAWKTTADAGLVADLDVALRAALAWIDRRSKDGTELVTYARKSPAGLDNQGWKDSRAGVSFPDGQRAVPPIALVEVQGYCVDAYRRGAELLAVLGDPEGAAAYAARAKTMARTVDDAFWMDGEERYAFAVDGAGRALPTVVSNVGHLLWSRVPSFDKARRTADLLVSPASLSAFGVRTLAAGQPVYNPLSYHNGTVWPHDNALIAKGFANYDLMAPACRVFESLVAAMSYFRDRRLPELYCGMSSVGDGLVRYPVACSPQAWAAAAPFLLLQAVLGIHVDGPQKRLLIRNPTMPASVGHVEIDGLRVGASRVALRLRRVGKRCHVDRLDVTGGAIRTFVEID
jgi:glycogen debranching enzyme